MTIDEIRKAQEDGFRFTVGTYPGVVFYFHSAEMETRTWYEADDEYEYESGMVKMIMVGDDHKHLIDPEDVELAGDYCRVCGQIGCTHDGLER